VSRAVAVAYAPSVRTTEGTEDRWPGRGDSSAYRLLGEEDRLLGGPQLLRLDEEVDLLFAESQDYLQEKTDLPVAYFETQEEQAKAQHRRIKTWPLLVGLVVATVLAIALMLVTPVLARGRLSYGAGPSSISRYSDLAANGSASVVSAAEIDTTSGSQVKAPQMIVPEASLPGGAYNLVAPPSISVNQIELVLSKYGSPAAGQGQVLYDLGVRYGIDPIYALAFFVHESGCGTRGVARFTHSLGNIRWTEGYDNYQGYRMYGSWQQGMEDWYKLITDLYINGWGLRTVEAIVPVYAPAGDGNDPPTYIRSVKAMVDSWRGK
jgi:hypothetical protein